MPTTTYKVEAILSAKDNGFSANMNKARDAAKDLGKGTKEATQDTKSFTQQVLAMSSALGITTLIKKGFDMIGSSVSAALDRQDTMDNFSRSVQNMTGDIRMADRALSDLTGKARGTAYGLDVVANSTKGLFTSGLELEKSVKYMGGWMDAVAQYGNGTNEQLGNVTYQLSQMVAKGKANLGDLKSAMEAGIPVVRMYAEATGQSTEEVSKSISNGSISAEQFMEVMDKAFTEGTKSFRAVNGAAKNAGSTWKGTFDNMRAATTRGVLSIINAIEDGRQKADMPGMKEAVKIFGIVSEKSLNLVAKAAGFVAEHFDKLTLTLKLSAAAWGVYKLYDTARKSLEAYGKAKAVVNMLSASGKIAIYAETGALTAKHIAIGVLTGKISLATAAQVIWNAAMTANPIGLLVVGIGTAIAAISALTSWLGKTSEEHKKANEEAKELASQNKDLANSTKELNDKYDKTTTSAKNNTVQAKRLVSELDRLSKSTDDASLKQYRMAKVVEELNSEYPELNVRLDETGTAIEGSTDAIYKQIEAMEEQAKMEAMKEYLSDLYKKQFELSNSIEVSTAKMREMEEAGTDQQQTWHHWATGLTEASDGYKELTDSVSEMEAEQLKVDEAIRISTESLGNLTQAQYEQMVAEEEQKRSLENLSEQYGLTSDAIVEYVDNQGIKLEEAGEAIVELADKYGVTTDSIVAYLNEQNMSIEEFSETHESNFNKAKSALQGYVDNATSGFKDLKQEATVSLAEYQEQLRKNVEATNKWSTNVNTLMKAGISEGLIKELEKMGPAGALQAERFVKELEELNGGALGEYESLNQATKDKLKELEGVFQEGIEASGRATETSLDAQKYYEKGEKVIEDMSRGIANSRAKLEKESLKSGEQVKTKFKEGTRGIDSDANVIGRQTGDGFNRGLSSRAGSIYSTANTIAYGVTSRIRQALAIRSPSRVMEKLGLSTGEGFAVGLEHMIPNVQAISSKMAYSVSDIDSSLRGGTSRFIVGADSPTRQAQPGMFRLVLGNREFEAYVEDITDTQDKTVRLKMAYEGG